MLRLGLVAIATLAVLPVRAHALKPAAHADLTAKACLDAGLPKPFCTRIATENYNTDGREWEDLHAHAQIDEGETACDGADRTGQRMFELGSELRTSLALIARSANDDSVGAAASAVGRALHTIQDNCAHHGMPNRQHAWYSLADFCDGTETSPDLQPEALACARVETKAAMDLIAAEIRRAGSKLAGYSCPEPTGGDNGQQQAVCQSRLLPAPWQACDFLGEAKEWDGIDRQWTNPPVIAALRAQLAAGIGATAAPASLCASNPSALGTPASTPIQDVSAGTPSCNRVHVFCLGKADDADNPFADDDADAAEASGGCATHRGSSSFVAMILVALTLRRRRRA